jgi:uncharacterized Zn-binding protein involved in type VI secretion
MTRRLSSRAERGDPVGCHRERSAAIQCLLSNHAFQTLDCHVGRCPPRNDGVVVIASAARRSSRLSSRAERGDPVGCHRERSAAIQSVVIASAARRSSAFCLIMPLAKPNPGLPRHFVPRNDEAGVIASAARRSSRLSSRAQRGDPVGCHRERSAAIQCLLSNNAFAKPNPGLPRRALPSSQ